MNLYLTADHVGLQSGGGLVTAQEAQALGELGPCEVWGREQLGTPEGPDPWGWDEVACRKWAWFGEERPVPRLAHVYAGTFTKTIDNLRLRGARVTYTAAAHDVALSRREHERLGFRYDYPHLTDPELWKRYVGGYLAADCLVCPSQHSAAVMRGFGAKNRIEVVSHGVHLPAGPVVPQPSQFRVGYLGAYGPDKGVVYLLQAWAKLDYPDAVLVLGGRDSASPFVRYLVRQSGAKNVVMTGWVKEIGDFYNGISLYVQPSVTEGFGCEVLEALAYGRPVLCSTGAGAVDLVPPWYTFPAADVDALAAKIDQVRGRGGCYDPRAGYPHWRETAALCTWDKVRARYQKLWKEMLA